MNDPDIRCSFHPKQTTVTSGSYAPPVHRPSDTLPDRADAADAAGLPQRRTHDYQRHATSTLFAALELATGTVTGACKPRHRHQEFLAFLKQVACAYPDDGSGTELHLVMDNYAAHKRVEVRDWLAANPRVHAHFTPTSGSWLNLVEVWFSIIERQAIHRGTFTSVTDLNAKIRAFIDGWNERSHPFMWTNTADEILKKATVRPLQTRTTR